MDQLLTGAIPDEPAPGWLPQSRMKMAKDKERIIALQKQLKIARDALEYLERYDVKAESALTQMNALEWNSRPTPLQALVGHERVRS